MARDYFTSEDGRLFREAKGTERSQAIAFCLGCNKVLERNPYWGPDKTRGLHQGGTGHKVLLLVPVG